MHSTGNDIIDLSQIDIDRSRQRRFFSKFLSVSEEQLFYRSTGTKLSFEQFVWLAWSVKEAVFKYQQRLSPALVFSPINIIVTALADPLVQSSGRQNEPHIDDCYTGSLLAGGKIYYFRSFINHAIISTVVNDAVCFNKVYWGMQKIEHTDSVTQSSAVRQVLLNKLEAVLPGGPLKVEKATAGYPVVYQNNQPLELPVSFSHHHSLVAYSFLLQ